MTSAPPILHALLEKLGVSPESITADSRKVQAGSLFLAYPGENADGRRYIEQAVSQGAAAVLWEEKDFSWNPAWQVANMPVRNLRVEAGFIADAFFGFPSRNLWMIGVTGTNGKSSCAHWLAQALTFLGRRTAVIGTLGNGFPECMSAAINTTPDPILLHGMLAEYLAWKAAGVAMEVSSHGLHQGRVNGVHFDVAVLTNLSRDHLDYHGTMEAYAEAKKKLFAYDTVSCSVLNADDDFGAELAQELKSEGKCVITYGLQDQQADVRGSCLEFGEHGLTMEVDTPYGHAELVVPLVGRFNAYNLLAVLATLLVSDVELEHALAALVKIQPPAGRMQQFGGGRQPLVVVDYAHSPDALEKVLIALREQARGRLVCVFGCGGNRDQGKRPLMGEVASRFADEVVVTSDNPRHEDPAKIIEAIVAGISISHEVIEDRAEAIHHSVSHAKAGDIVLVAGKGHEDYQEIAGVKYPFSDQGTVQSALQQYVEAAA